MAHFIRFLQSKDQKYIQSFGKHLRNLRKANNLSQEDLANDADIPILQVGRSRRGEFNTTFPTIYVLAEALKAEIADLFNFDEKS